MYVINKKIIYTTAYTYFRNIYKIEIGTGKVLNYKLFNAYELIPIIRVRKNIQNTTVPNSPIGP